MPTYDDDEKWQEYQRMDRARKDAAQKVGYYISVGCLILTIITIILISLPYLIK